MHVEHCVIDNPVDLICLPARLLMTEKGCLTLEGLSYD